MKVATHKIIIAAICAVMVFALVAIFAATPVMVLAQDTPKDESVTQYAGASVPAPFGLQWGMTCKEISALGAKDLGKTPCALVGELPKGLKGYRSRLSFDKSGGLIKVQSGNIANRNPATADMEVRNIKRALNSKYGEGVGWDGGTKLLWGWSFADGSSIELLGGSGSKDFPGFISLNYTTAAAYALEKEQEEIEAEL